MKKIEGVEIFRSGDHIDADGNIDVYYIDDLKGMVGSYNPKIHEAPIVWGHDKDKAWHRNLTRKSQLSNGWILKLYIVGSTLLADLEVDEDTYKAIKNKKLKKRSVGLYRPDSENNPVPGEYYVRHLALLGVEPPAIKGLKDIVIYSEKINKKDSLKIPTQFGEVTDSSRKLYIEIVNFQKSNNIPSFLEAKRRYEMPESLRKLVYKI